MSGFIKDLTVVICLLASLATIVRTIDGSSITWHEPPPSETVTDTAITSTTDTNVTKGSLNEELSCNFSLTADMNFFAVSFDLGNVAVASYLNGEYPTVADRFVSRFNVTWVPSKLTLIVFNVTNDDKGEYLCRVQALSGGLKTWLRIIKVDVLVQARITNITGKTATEGGNVTMNCLVEGNPTPAVTWRRLSDDRVVTMPLTNIRRKNASVGYKCIADNGVRTPAIVEAFIDVQYPVEPIGNGENATVIEGGVKNFSCPVVGNPKPTIIWYKGIRRGGEIIYSGKEFEAREAGCYTCVAKNSLGTSVSIMHCLKVNASQELSTAIIVTNPTSKPTSISEDPPWTIIGVVVGVVVVMVPAIVFVIWRIRKKRKKNYRRETKHGDLHYEGVANFDSLVRTATSEHQKPDSDE